MTNMNVPVSGDKEAVDSLKSVSDGWEPNRRQPRVGPTAYTKDWWLMRDNCFGASEAAAVCGVSRYSQPLDVYANKLKKDKVRDQSKDKEHFKRGRRFEGTILDWYHEILGGTMMTPPMLIHPEFDFMCATPDALWSDRTPEEIGIMEGHGNEWSWDLSYIPVDAKTTQKHSSQPSEFGEEGTDDIQQEYIMQAQQQMAVTDAKRCDLPVLFQNYELKVYTVRRNDDLIKMILDGEREMMDRLMDNNPPEPDWTHPKTYDIIREIHNVSDETVELCDHVTDTWNDIEYMQDQVREINKSIKSEKARVLHDMGDAGMGILKDGRLLVRKKIKRDAYEVKASEYVTLRCKKVR